MTEQLGVKEDFYVENRAKQLWIVFCVSLGAFMANLDITIVNISLPTIAHELNVNQSKISLIVICYQIFETSFLLVFGKLGDMKSYRFVYLLGFVVFTIGSLFCGLSTNLTHLVASRVIQGIGGAMLFAVMMSAVAAFIPAKSRGKAVGTVVTAAAVGIALGPVIGGFIASVLNWRWIFFVNVPIGIIAVIMGLFVLPSKQMVCKEKKFDYIGSFASFAVLFSLVFAIQMLHKHGAAALTFIIWFAIFIIFSVFFVIWERRVKYPLLDFSLFKNINFSLVNIASVPPFMNYAGILFVMPFYLEVVRRVDIRTSGLILSVVALGQMMGPFAGHLADKAGAKKILLIGLIMGIASCLILSFICDSMSLLLITAALFLQGLSAGFGRGTSVQLSIEYCRPDQQGLASSVSSILRSFAILIGTIAYVQVFSYTIHKLNPLPQISLSRSNLSHDMITSGFHSVFLFSLILSIVTLLMILFIRDKKTAA
ncbi:MAG: DHA2 family efflux MFS transporter permease subunit [Firmicutes bacterium]|nr:DHA2 family efflux MFS transporter permease subunit [Bacillota bacterium]